MNIRNMFSTVMLISALSVPALAASTQNVDVLYNNQNLNTELDVGEYDFASQHSQYGSLFTDSWKFTVASDSLASISIYDIETAFGQPSTQSTSLPQVSLKQNRAQINTSMIFDTTNMVLSVFDSNGFEIGQTGENGTLANLNLAAGGWYTILVSGKVNGFFGSSYHGVLDVTPVPLGDTAPLFGSALVLLALRLRKRTAA